MGREINTMNLSKLEEGEVVMEGMRKALVVGNDRETGIVSTIGDDIFGGVDLALRKYDPENGCLISVESSEHIFPGNENYKDYQLKLKNVV